MTKWNNCLLVYSSGRLVSCDKQVCNKKKITQAVNIYKKKINKEPDYNVW
ncbi:unnamed protein product, partial [marine sediment metagenome]